MNSTADTRIEGLVRCGRQTPKKGDGATSATITTNGVMACRGKKADGTLVSDVEVLVAALTITLDPDTGIVTTGGTNETETYGDASFGVVVAMTVSGSGTTSVTVSYTIPFKLTGGAVDGISTMPNPVTVNFIYTGEEVEEE